MSQMLLKYTLASTDTGADKMQVYVTQPVCQHPVLQHAVVALLVFMMASQFVVSVGLLHPRQLQKYFFFFYQAVLGLKMVQTASPPVKVDMA